MPGDKPEVSVSRCGLGRFARHGGRAWRHDDGRVWMTLDDGGGNALLVVGAVPGERGHRCRDLVEQGADLGAPSSCWLLGKRVGKSRAMLARSSSRGGNTADVCPYLERARPCGAVLDGGDVVAAEMEEIADLVVAERKRCAWPADLKRFIWRSRRRVGWCEFSARLFRPLCRRCSTPGIISFLAAP